MKKSIVKTSWLSAARIAVLIALLEKKVSSDKRGYLTERGRRRKQEEKEKTKKRETVWVKEGEESKKEELGEFRRLRRDVRRRGLKNNREKKASEFSVKVRKT